MARHQLTTANILRLRRELESLRKDLATRLQPAIETARSQIGTVSKAESGPESPEMETEVSQPDGSLNQQSASELEDLVGEASELESRISELDELLADPIEIIEISQATHDRLTLELKELTTRGRLEVATRIDEARALGDLKENGDYHAAKEDQGLLEARIRDVESILRRCSVVTTFDSDRVGLCSVVTLLYDGDSEDQAERFLLGHVEEGHSHDDLLIVSPWSPLGSALLDVSVGEQISYSAPNGELTVRVLGVSEI
jgi:transcription elongation factor GreA